MGLSEGQAEAEAELEVETLKVLKLFLVVTWMDRISLKGNI